ncbi:MAG: hypothetical protein NTW03_04485 [Verrucomicrobia bacterium]|nr:hypothetical protein [Verrucomicrobiota bacterium]
MSPIWRAGLRSSVCRGRPGAAGHLSFLGGAGTPSTGTLQPGGTFTGAYSKTYSITIAAAGVSGTARFNWAATLPGGGSSNNVLTGANVPLDQGVSVSFLDGTGTSFQANDRWLLYVRADLIQPTNPVLSAYMANGVAGCATCHDEHSELVTPFDPNALAYTGPGTGTNRHFMRIPNDLHQMCIQCHAKRAVTNSLAGSHPVEITVPVDSLHKAPTPVATRENHRPTGLPHLP